jgi:DNA-binding PadR family transcriptional regulator
MDTSHVRITASVLKVLGAFLSTTDELSGADVSKVTGLASGTLYPILIRLEESKWLQSEWESGDPSVLGRPRRRLYKITGLGARAARRELKSFKSLIGRAAWITS